MKCRNSGQKFLLFRTQIHRNQSRQSGQTVREGRCGSGGATDERFQSLFQSKMGEEQPLVYFAVVQQESCRFQVVGGRRPPILNLSVGVHACFSPSPARRTPCVNRCQTGNSSENVTSSFRGRLLGQLQRYLESAARGVEGRGERRFVVLEREDVRDQVLDIEHACAKQRDDRLVVVVPIHE